ncbi:hypothetical protein HJG60_008129 [Phyllostomus discolor]|uniref:Uncharacterized protein n=1 Tax=Phyllostomus discolor TaxID=89673 RepID=A0A833Z859_9CHIR|nr:hypothetical protein HJG60_008129 [Phyllostomus discolor]
MGLETVAGAWQREGNSLPGRARPGRPAALTRLGKCAVSRAACPSRVIAGGLLSIFRGRSSTEEGFSTVRAVVGRLPGDAALKRAGPALAWPTPALVTSGHCPAFLLRSPEAQDAGPRPLLPECSARIGPARARTFDTSRATRCTHSSPGAVLALGRQNGPCPKETYASLASDMQELYRGFHDSCNTVTFAHAVKSLSRWKGARRCLVPMERAGSDGHVVKISRSRSESSYSAGILYSVHSLISHQGKKISCCLCRDVWSFLSAARGPWRVTQPLKCPCARQRHAVFSGKRR